MPLDRGRLFDLLQQTAPTSPYNGARQPPPFLTSGEIILVEDTTGQGHLSKAVAGQIRHSIFIPID